MQRRLATEHREPRVIREQGEDQRTFLPVEKVVEQVARIEIGEIDVVDMDEHARFEPGNDLEIDSQDIRAGFHHVGRVDEEQVTRLQLIED